MCTTEACALQPSFPKQVCSGAELKFHNCFKLIFPAFTRVSTRNNGSEDVLEVSQLKQILINRREKTHWKWGESLLCNIVLFGTSDMQLFLCLNRSSNLFLQRIFYEYLCTLLWLSKESPHSHYYIVCRVSWKAWNPQEQEDTNPENRTSEKKISNKSAHSRRGVHFCLLIEL